MGAGPALAAPGAYVTVGYGINACESGKLCLYKDVNHNSRATHAVMLTNRNVNSLSNYEFDNKASSYVNRSGRVVTLYKGQLHKGAEMTLDPGNRARVFPTGWDDTITSIKFH
ncbi:hypothetical protein A6A06_11980 [Streptomyces sp. CB02923]|nr:hypothetical protein A6A06_11980 [Streptomyces sp. CB02923]